MNDDEELRDFLTAADHDTTVAEWAAAMDEEDE